MQPLVSIVIPNWNGRSFLARCLAGTLQSAQDSGFGYECIVLDDASTDGSADIVERDFPQVRLIRQPANLGFGQTMNRGTSVANGQFLVCLNNDLVPKPVLIQELIQPLLEDAQLFGVSGKTVDWKDGSANHVNMAAHWTGTGLEVTYENSREPTNTMFLQGGCCAMRKDQFVEFGGFSELYSPGYWEDYDISYGALKAGWRNLYNPRALAYHFGGASMGKALGEDGLRLVKERNRHLFHLANLTDKTMLHQYCCALASSVAFARQPRLQVRLGAVRECMKRVRQLEEFRSIRAKWQKRTDREVLAEFVGHGNASVR